MRSPHTESCCLRENLWGQGQGEDDCPWVGHCKPPTVGRPSEPGEKSCICVTGPQGQEGKPVGSAPSS